MKYGMFAFIFTLLNFMTFYVVDGEGAGGDQGGEGDDSSNDGDDGADGGQDGDLGDLELDGDDESDEGESTLNADEIKAAKEIIAQNNETQMINTVEKEIQTRVPGFNANKVLESLRELNKTDPKLAAYYNASPAAWEMYHKEHIANVAENDNINNGSHSGSGGDFHSTLEKARSGDKKSIKEALAKSKA